MLARLRSSWKGELRPDFSVKATRIIKKDQFKVLTHLVPFGARNSGSTLGTKQERVGEHGAVINPLAQFTAQQEVRH